MKKLKTTAFTILLTLVLLVTALPYNAKVTRAAAASIYDIYAVNANGHWAEPELTQNGAAAPTATGGGSKSLCGRYVTGGTYTTVAADSGQMFILNDATVTVGSNGAGTAYYPGSLVLLGGSSVDYGCHEINSTSSRFRSFNDVGFVNIGSTLSGETAYTDLTSHISSLSDIGLCDYKITGTCEYYSGASDGAAYDIEVLASKSLTIKSGDSYSGGQLSSRYPTHLYLNHNASINGTLTIGDAQNIAGTGVLTDGSGNELYNSFVIENGATATVTGALNGLGNARLILKVGGSSSGIILYDQTGAQFTDGSSTYTNAAAAGCGDLIFAWKEVTPGVYGWQAPVTIASQASAGNGSSSGSGSGASSGSSSGSTSANTATKTQDATTTSNSLNAGQAIEEKAVQNSVNASLRSEENSTTDSVNTAQDREDTQKQTLNAETSSSVVTVHFSGNQTSAENWGNVETVIEQQLALSSKDTLEVLVELGEDTLVPVSVLQTLCGKRMNLTLDLGSGVRWTISGETMDAANLQDINMGVTVGGGSIPQELVAQAAGDNDVVLLSLTHDGAFGFQATMHLDLDAANAGKYANLFYYNEEFGGMELLESVQIDENGIAAFSYEHASDYAVVIALQNFVADAEEGIMPLVETLDPEMDATEEKTFLGLYRRATGLLMIGVAVFALVVVGFLVVKKVKK